MTGAWKCSSYYLHVKDPKSFVFAVFPQILSGKYIENFQNIKILL
jgi:hypothetical protein